MIRKIDEWMCAYPDTGCWLLVCLAFWAGVASNPIALAAVLLLQMFFMAHIRHSWQPIEGGSRGNRRKS